MKRKILFVFLMIILIISSTVYANDVTPETVNSDLYTSGENENLLDSEIAGNVFDVSNSFELSPASVVNGDVFVVSKKVSLKSDVTYSDSISKDNEQSIDRINSSATINGNVYAVCNEFVLEPGVEIKGDLYVVAKSVVIQKSSVIHGNVFTTAISIVLNGRVENSVYAVTKSFETSYYGSIYKDLNLSSDSVSLNSVIRRNSNITCESIKTGSYFLNYGDTNITSKLLHFSGEIDGNATINSKDVSFVDQQEDTSIKCIIKGDLNYSSEKEIENIDTYVNGAVVHSTYKSAEKQKSKFSFKSFILELLTFVVYIFVVAWLFTLLNKKYLDKKLTLSVGNVFATLGIGLLAYIAVLVLCILLFIINIGATLSIAILLAFALLMILSKPLFVLDIANMLKNKFNVYLGILIISLVLFLVCAIPFLGGLISFLFTTIGLGRLIQKLLHCSK